MQFFDSVIAGVLACVLWFIKNGLRTIIPVAFAETLLLCRLRFSAMFI